MNSILSFITIQKQHGESLENIIRLLMNNFEKEIDTEMKARQYLQQWSEEIRIKTEAYGNKNRIVDSNPGFETLLFNEVFPETTFLSIVMQNINNIHYISLLEIYLHSIVILLKKLEMGERLNEKVESLCKKSSKKIQKIEQEERDIKEKVENAGPIMFDLNDDSLDDLSDFSDGDDDEDGDELDFAELLDKEKTNDMEKEVSPEVDTSLLKISKKLSQQEHDDELESDEEEDLDIISKEDSATVVPPASVEDPSASVEDPSATVVPPDSVDAPSAAVDDSVEKKKFPSPIPDLSIKSKTPDAPLDSLSSLSESPGEGDDELESDEEEDLDIVSKEDSPSSVVDSPSASVDAPSAAVDDSVEKKKFPSPIPDLAIKSESPDVPLDSLSSLSESPGESVSPLSLENSKSPEPKKTEQQAQDLDDSDIEIGDDEINFDDELDPESDDSLESDEDDDSLDFGQGGGADSDSEDELDIDLSKYSLSGAKNIFMLKKREKDPRLFLKKDQPHYKSYTRSCPNQYKKQPVLITDEEKNYIDEQDTKSGVKSYDEYIRYGTGEKKYNYICPRFWCVRDDNGKSRSLSLKQVNDGECGGWRALIPENAKKIPKGKRIVEFNDERFHRENSKNTSPGDPARRLIYRPMYPGFMDRNKHPDGLCIPCCFQAPGTDGPDETEVYEKMDNGKYRDKKTGEELERPKISDMFKPFPKPTFDTDEKGNIIMESIKGENKERPAGATERQEMRLDCNQAKILANDGNSKEIGSKPKSRTREKDAKVEDTPTLQFPLKNGQLGYMKPALEGFLGFSSKNRCYTSSEGNINKRLRSNHPCILRLGIEKNRNQSFLCLLASVYKFYNIRDGEENKIRLTTQVENLQEFKDYFLENLTIDKFLVAQNGILPQIFKAKTNIAVSKYNDSFFLSKIEDNIRLKKKLRSSYENFINYFKSDNVFIDYTYLWDLISKPKNEGGVLFSNGINLFIFKNANNDMTDKIELICPTHYNSSEFFDEKKPTLMVYTENNFFEPLCKMTRTSSRDYIVKKFFIKQTFTADGATIIFDTILKIKKSLQEGCLPKNSIGQYDYFMNISPLEIIEILSPFGYEFNLQYVNNNFQTIGLSTKVNGETFYLPCKASGVITGLNIEFVSAQTNFQSYRKTFDFLNTVYVISENRIQSNPVKKIVSDDHVVGIITSSNQFVPILPERLDESDDDIPSEKSYYKPHELLLDDKVLHTRKKDVERNIIVKKLTLENKFYGLFRNTLKILLNYRQNLELKEELKTIIDDPILTYVEKMEEVRSILISILKNVVVFQKFKLSNLDDYDNMINCIGLTKEVCDQSKNCSYLLREENGICRIILPKKNLYSRVKNKDYYYIKLSDELIRFSKIRKYIFTPKSFLSFHHVKYKINSDEIVLLEELFETYFDNIVLQTSNEFINNNIYETSDPILSLKYSNNIDFNEEVKESLESVSRSLSRDKVSKLGKTTL